MPSALIEIRREISADEEIAIIEAVHLALREAFKIPPRDRNVRLVAHRPHRFACPPQLARVSHYLERYSGCSGLVHELWPVSRRFFA